MKKKAADREKNQEVTGDKSNNELELLIPNMVKLEPRTYTPGRFLLTTSYVFCLLRGF